jgi:hypothetical protein
MVNANLMQTTAQATMITMQKMTKSSRTMQKMTTASRKMQKMTTASRTMQKMTTASRICHKSCYKEPMGFIGLTRVFIKP